MESESFELAIRDIKKGLEVQEAKLADDSRALAETHYKLGMAYGMDSQHDESVKCYTKAMEVLKKRLSKSTSDKEKKDLEELIPEVEEKISDMKNMKDEVRVIKSCRGLVNRTLRSFAELAIQEDELEHNPN